MLTHLDSQGRASMVDVTDKAVTAREAVAEARVRMLPQTLQLIQQGGHPKGDVFAVARIAGIQAAKKTPELLPLAHVIGVHGAVVDLTITDTGVDITATVRTTGATEIIADWHTPPRARKPQRHIRLTGELANGELCREMFALHDPPSPAGLSEDPDRRAFGNVIETDQWLGVTRPLDEEYHSWACAVVGPGSGTSSTSR